MRFNKMQVLGLLLVLGMVTVPSLAFPNNSKTGCYTAELTDAGETYGNVKLLIKPDGSRLIVEVENYVPGDYEVVLFKDYYSDLVLGNLTIRNDGAGKGSFNCPLQEPDFIVYVESDTHTLTSGDWVECEMPNQVKISPSTLNLKSNGKWVTVKIMMDDPIPEGFELTVNGAPVEYEITSESPNHVIVKILRSDLQALCESGVNSITISYMSGGEPVQYSDTFRVINMGNPHQTVAQEKVKVNTNNGLAKGKNKDK